MKAIFTLLVLLNSITAFSQKTEQEILQLRENHLQTLLDSSNSILSSEELENFQGLDYYPFDAQYQILAKFTKSKGKKFEMSTSTELKALYRRYGYVDFTFNNEFHRLTVYQNISLKKQAKYKDYLFLPFRDSTSKTTTYGGGRYLDLRIPDNSEILIDFNLAYNPYCAYSIRYSCPIPPEENTLTIPIKAGEKYTNSH